MSGADGPLSFLSPEAQAALEKLVRAIAADVVGQALADGARLRQSEYLTPEEAAEVLRAKPQRVYDLCSDGRLTRYKDGSRTLVSRRELDAYLACRRGP